MLAVDKTELSLNLYDDEQTKIFNEKTIIFPKPTTNSSTVFQAHQSKNNDKHLFKQAFKNGSTPLASALNIEKTRIQNVEKYSIFDTTHHSNSIGILIARDYFEKASKDKGKLLNNRFVLESILGLGGMGIVYRTKDLRRVEAEDPSPYVATKVLNDDFKNHPNAFVTLQQETVKSQILSHPNIVTVHDFDRDGNTLYMTMELLSGNSLDKLIKQNHNSGLPSNDCISIFDDLCEGLSYAHKNKLIHSDFKPMNIFITHEKVTKILDFGISRVCSNSDANSTRFDAGELGAITVEFASLEMIKKNKPQFSDDIYGLACVLYMMLTGKHPYNRVPADLALKKKLQPKRIDKLSNNQWVALKKGLALESKNRYKTVNEFKKAFHKKKPVRLLTILNTLSIFSVPTALLLSYFYIY